MKVGYKRTEIGILPKDWDVEPLGKIGESLIGLTYRPSDVRSHGTLVLRSSNVQEGGLRFADNVFVEAKIPRRLMVRPDDILICVRNGSRDLIGKSVLIDDRARGMTFGAFMAIFRSPSGRFIQYLFQSDILKRQINEHLGATINQITNKSLNSFKVPFPPTDDEKHAIARTLGDVDELLEALERLIAKKRDLKQAAMQQLLTGQTRLPGFWGKWGVRRVGDFAFCTSGGTPSTSIPAYWGGSIRWMSSGELNQKRVYEVFGRITNEGLRNSSASLIPVRCVLIGLAGQGKTRGTVAMNLVELCTNQSVAAILPGPSFNPQYLYHNLDSRYEELRELSSGGGGRGGLNLSNIKAIPVPFPSFSEQTAIADILSDMDSELAALESRHEKTRAIKQAMMQELLTGKTRLVPAEAAIA